MDDLLERRWSGKKSLAAPAYAVSYAHVRSGLVESLAAHLGQARRDIGSLGKRGKTVLVGSANAQMLKTVLIFRLAPTRQKLESETEIGFMCGCGTETSIRSIGAKRCVTQPVGEAP